MFRRSVVTRRRGSPLLGTAILGGAAYAAGKSAQRGATREQVQEQRLSQLEQQQARGMPQQGYQNVPPASQPASQPGMSVPPASQPAPQQMRQQPSLQPQVYQQSASMPQEDLSAPQATSATETSPDKLTQLKTLGELRISGVLTDVEFEEEKQKILRS